MKKSIILCCIFLISNAHLFAQEHEAQIGIQFTHNSWSEIVAQAKKENKLIFLDAYASWCGPCKWMAKNVFTDNAVADFYNRTFVCAKIDMEKGEGIELAKKFSVLNYPTLLYIDAGEAIVHRTCGVDYTAAASATFIHDGKDAIDPMRNIIGLRKNFETNTANSETAYAYINALSRTCCPYGDELKKYFDTQKETELTSATNWGMISNFVNDPLSREFDYFFTNKDAFAKQHTMDSVEHKISDVFESGLQNSIRAQEDEKYLLIKKKLQTAGIKNGETMLQKSDMDFYGRKKDWSQYAEAAKIYLNGNGKADVNRLNAAAWNFYENVNDKKLLTEAEVWVKNASAIENSYAINDTYAAVLYKLGKKNEAKTAAEKAIELAKKENTDFAGTSELLEKIKLMK